MFICPPRPGGVSSYIKLLRKALFGLVFLLLFSFTPGVVFGQEATESAQVEDGVVVEEATPSAEVVEEATSSASAVEEVGQADDEPTFAQNDASSDYGYSATVGDSSIQFLEEDGDKAGFLLSNSSTSGSEYSLQVALSELNGAQPASNAYINGSSIEFDTTIGGIDMKLRYTVEADRVKEEFVVFAVIRAIAKSGCRSRITQWVGGQGW